MKPIDRRAVEAGALAALASHPYAPSVPAIGPVVPRGADPVGWRDDFDRGEALARECVERACGHLPLEDRLPIVAAALRRAEALDSGDIDVLAATGRCEEDVLVELITNVTCDACPDEAARENDDAEEEFDDGQDAAPLLLRRLWRRDERGQFYIGEPPPLSTGVRVSRKRRGVVECVFGIGEVQVAWDDGTRSTEHGSLEVE